MKTLTLLLAVFISVYGFSTDYSFSIGGKQYKIVTTKKNWADAAAWAVTDGGHLVHIDSKNEQDSIWAAIQASGISMTYTVVNDGGGIAYIWIGATDKKTEGTWLWDGDDDGTGTHFYTGQGAWGSNNGTVVNGAYNNWGGTNTGTNNEPDDYGSTQDAAGIGLDAWPYSGSGNIAGEWNDINKTNPLYFIVEYESVGINENKSMILPKVKVFQTGTNKIKIAADARMNNLKVFSISGAEVLFIESVNSTELVFVLPENGIYFYRTKFDNGAVISGKIAVL